MAATGPGHGDIDRLYVYSDGASRGNPGHAAIGIVICGPGGEVLRECGQYIGRKTNNVAEYVAMIIGLELASKFGRREVICLSDSKLVVNQMGEKWMVTKDHIGILVRKARESGRRFSKVSYVHLGREDPGIRRADELANAALDARLGVQ